MKQETRLKYKKVFATCVLIIVMFICTMHIAKEVNNYATIYKKKNTNYCKTLWRGIDCSISLEENYILKPFAGVEEFIIPSSIIVSLIHELLITTSTFLHIFL